MTHTLHTDSVDFKLTNIWLKWKVSALIEAVLQIYSKSAALTFL